MIRRFINWLRRDDSVAPDPLDVARERREAAWRAYQDAKRRKDSRDVHWASRRLRDATTDLVRLELGR